MSVEKITETQVPSASWIADQRIQAKLEDTGLITRIDVTVEVTPSATFDGANQEDGLWRIIQNLRIQGGTHQYFGLPADDGAQGGTLLHYMNRMDGFSHGHENGDVAAPSAAYVPINFVLHCGSRPRDMYNRDDPFDLTAFIPAGEESSLTAEWTTSGADVMDDTITIASAEMRFTIHRVIGTEQELKEEMARQGVVLPGSSDIVTGMLPAWTAVSHKNVSATTSVEGETLDIPGAGFLKRISILEQDAVADVPNRASNQVSEIAIIQTGGSRKLYNAGVEHMLSILPPGSNLEADDVGPTFGAHVPEGLYFIDLRPRSNGAVGRDYGWDLRGSAAPDLKLGFVIDTFATGDDTLIIYERYETYHGRLAS